MRLYSSLWNADDWATQGGRVKTDWSHAASYRGFKADACVASAAGDWYNQELDLTRQQRKYMIYNYCTDPKRFPQGLPAECAM
jgi:hypothetical protein